MGSMATGQKTQRERQKKRENPSVSGHRFLGSNMQMNDEPRSPVARPMNEILHAGGGGGGGGGGEGRHLHKRPAAFLEQQQQREKTNSRNPNLRCQSINHCNLLIEFPISG